MSQKPLLLVTTVIEFFNIYIFNALFKDKQSNIVCDAVINIVNHQKWKYIIIMAYYKNETFTF